ncbi:hypothetical protein VHEMI03762 [[Torrubiella] hemipterigena]|uniref:Uncharacterized protein n=1 Tax=[Torrubiella] hemipterigena TaxID=1531966 RepID=A0A0A1SZE2_9HYPO|nr:hypothetical protein VHEMI03762 [[Torrubiella] hemipterigena]
MASSMDQISLPSSIGRFITHRRTKSSGNPAGQDTPIANTSSPNGKAWLPVVKRKAVPSPIAVRRLTSLTPQPFSLPISRPQPITPDNFETYYPRNNSDNASITSNESGSSRYSSNASSPEPSPQRFNIPGAMPPARPARPEQSLYETAEEELLLKSPMAPSLSSPSRTPPSGSRTDLDIIVSPLSDNSSPTGIDDIITQRYETTVEGPAPTMVTHSVKKTNYPPAIPTPSSTTSISRRPSVKKPKKARVSLRIGRTATQRSSSSRKKSTKKKPAKKIGEKLGWPKRFNTKAIRITVSESVSDLISSGRSKRPESLVLDETAAAAAHADYLKNDIAEWTRESLFLETGKWPMDSNRPSPLFSPSPGSTLPVPQDTFHLEEQYPRNLARTAAKVNEIAPAVTEVPPVVPPKHSRPAATPVALEPMPEAKPVVVETPVAVPEPAKPAEPVETFTAPPPPVKNPARFAARMNMTQLPTIPENLLSPTSTKLGAFSRLASVHGLKKAGPFRKGTLRSRGTVHLIPRKKIGQNGDVNWSEFQLAIMCGAGDLISGMAEDEAREFADDMADWFDTFGFDSHGELVPDDLEEDVTYIPLLNISSGESSASSIASDEVDFPIPVSTLLEDHIVGAINSRSSSPDSDYYSFDPESLVGPEKLTVSRRLSSRFQMQKRSRSVSPVEDIEPAQDSPMSCNMNNDLGQFLEWNPSAMYAAPSYESPDDVCVENIW